MRWVGRYAGLILLLAISRAVGAAGETAFPLSTPNPQLMFAERAFVRDVRVTLYPPTLADYGAPGILWPLARDVSRALERKIEDLIFAHFLHICNFGDQPLPNFPHLAFHASTHQRDIGKVRPLVQNETYERDVITRLSVIFLDDGRTVSNLQMRLRFSRSLMAKAEDFLKVELIEVEGRRLTNGPVDGFWDTVRFLNEQPLLDAIIERDPICEQLLK